MSASCACPSAGQTWVAQARVQAGSSHKAGAGAGSRGKPGQAGAARRAAVLAFGPCAREQSSVAAAAGAALCVGLAVGWCQRGGGSVAAGHARLRLLECVLLLVGSRLGLRLRLRPRGLGLLLLSSLGKGWKA
jgi:hypothetical protein